MIGIICNNYNFLFYKLDSIIPKKKKKEKKKRQIISRTNYHERNETK